MAELSVIPKRMPEKFDDVDTDLWAAEALCMLKNQDWNTRPHFLVGLDEFDMWRHSLAFYHVMKAQEVPVIRHARNTVRQRMSLDGMLEQENIYPMPGTTNPNTFFDLMEGSFAIPMGDSIDAISDAYDSGHAIWIVKLKFKG
jgi:hypothetical protein